MGKIELEDGNFGWDFIVRNLEEPPRTCPKCSATYSSGETDYRRCSDCNRRTKAEEPQTILIQTDWDYPGFATTFGWSIASVQTAEREEEENTCDHDTTDGTVDCKECGLRVSDFLSAACDYLRDNIGAIVDDPGYFS